MDPSDAALPLIFDYLAVMLFFGVVGALISRIEWGAGKSHLRAS